MSLTAKKLNGAEIWFLIIVLFLFCHQKGISSTPKNFISDTLACRLIWDGIVFDSNNKKLEDATVSVFADSVLVSEVKSDKQGKCQVEIAMNKKVKVIISKPNYVSKILIIDTTVPFTKCHTNFSLPYSVYLFKYQKGIDVEILKKPIAVIQYYPKRNLFSYDLKHVKKINNLIIDRYEDYNRAMLHSGKTKRQK